PRQGRRSRTEDRQVEGDRDRKGPNRRHVGAPRAGDERARELPRERPRRGDAQRDPEDLRTGRCGRRPCREQSRLRREGRKARAREDQDRRRERQRLRAHRRANGRDPCGEEPGRLATRRTSREGRKLVMTEVADVEDEKASGAISYRKNRATETLI